MFLIFLIIVSITVILSFENIYKRIVLQTYNDFTNKNSFHIFSEFHQNCYEISLNELAKILFDKYGENKIIYANPNVDDPRLRKPDIQRAKEILKWSPTISINKGIEKTYSYFKKKLIIN